MKKTIDYFPEGADTLNAFQSAKKRYEVLLKNLGAGKSSFQDIPLRAPFLHPNVVVSVKMSASKFGGAATFANLLDRRIRKLEETVVFTAVATQLTPSVEIGRVLAYRRNGIPNHGVPPHFLD